MNQQQVQSQLNDLPATFTRPGPPYNQWVDAITVALTTFTQSVDALQAQFNFATTQERWIDIWGLLAGIPRYNNESNVSYQKRIQFILTTWRDSVVAMEQWLYIINGIIAPITENLPSVGYTISLPPMLDQQLQALLTNLKYVRPAGVPFNIQFIRSGTYLNTLDYYAGPAPGFIVNPDGSVVLS